MYFYFFTSTATRYWNYWRSRGISNWKPEGSLFAFDDTIEDRYDKHDGGIYMRD